MQGLGLLLYPVTALVSEAMHACMAQGPGPGPMIVAESQGGMAMHGPPHGVVHPAIAVPMHAIPCWHMHMPPRHSGTWYQVHSGHLRHGHACMHAPSPPLSGHAWAGAGPAHLPGAPGPGVLPSPAGADSHQARQVHLDKGPAAGARPEVLPPQRPTLLAHQCHTVQVCLYGGSIVGGLAA